MKQRFSWNWTTSLALFGLVSQAGVARGDETQQTPPPTEPGSGLTTSTVTGGATQTQGLEAYITGIVTVDAGGNPSGFVDLTKDVIIGGNANGIPLPAGQPVLVGNQGVKVSVQQVYGGKVYRYDALFGGEASYALKYTMEVRQSPPWLVAHEGWVLIAGDWPLVEARLVTAIADGTEMVTIAPRVGAGGTETDRVYLLSASSKVNVDKRDGSESKLMIDQNTYCEVTKGTAGFTCNPIDPSDAAYNRVIAMAQKAGMK